MISGMPPGVPRGAALIDKTMWILQEEEEMILSVCRNAQEEELMRSCTYAYQYPANLVLKCFREEKRERR